MAKTPTPTPTAVDQPVVSSPRIGDSLRRGNDAALLEATGKGEGEWLPDADPLIVETEVRVAPARSDMITDMSCGGGCRGVIDPERLNVEAFLFGAFEEGDPVTGVVVLIDVRSDVGVLLSAGTQVPVGGANVAGLVAAGVFRILSVA